MDDEKSINEIKKIFNNILPGINFFSDFTLQDVEVAKKKLFYHYKIETNENEEKIKAYIDKISNDMIKDKFSLSMEKPQDVVVKNTIKDTLNPNYRNTINRITQIDSQYRNSLLQSNNNSLCSDTYLNETNFTSQLTDTLSNVVSIKVESISIPYTFYNIEEKQGNHIFIINDVPFTISDGFYTITTLINKLNSLQNTNTTFTLIEGTGKIEINTSHEVIFYDNTDINFKNTNINNSLGWILGIRDIYYNDDIITSSINVSPYTTKYIAYIPTIKYFVLTLDDFNNNQSNKSLVQLYQGKEPHTKTTNYYKNINEKKTNYYRNKGYDTDTAIDNNITGNVCIDTLKLSDLSTISDKSSPYKNRGLTQKQFYTQAAINDKNDKTEIKIIQEPMPNIIAIIPFEPKSLIWGQSIFFSDKNKYSRDYHGPVDIDKMKIKIFDDKGNILNLNGSEWSMTIVSKHLYKY